MALAAPGWVAAADPVDPAPAGARPQLEQLRPAPPVFKDTPAAVMPDTPALPRELGKPTDDVTLDVTAYTVDDKAPQALREALPALTAAFVGKQRNYEDMVNAAATVTRFMQRELGYYLAYAYLPEQTPKDGVVRIAVLEGRLDQVIVQWPDKLAVNKEVIEGYLAKLKPGDILKVRDVERVVFTVNDLYGVRARFEVKAGRYPGTASLLVTPQSEPRFSGKVEFDINGSRFSGSQRLTAVATMASPTGRGDNLSVSGLVSTTGGLKFALLSYSTPVGSDGLKVGGSISTVAYQLDRGIFPLNLNGEANAASLFSLYPLIRSRNLNTFVLGTLENKTFDDTLAGITNQKTSENIQLGVVGDFRDNFLTGGVNAYEVNWLKGRLKLNTGTLTVPGNFNKLGLGFSRLQNILSGRVLAYVRYKGQFTQQNLDTTERFGLGGATGVRAFAPGDGTADAAHLLSAELRWLPPESFFGRSAREMAFSGFFDIGHAEIEHDPSSGIRLGAANKITLGGVGVGFVWDRPQVFGLRVSLAWPTTGKDEVATKPRSPRLFAGFTKNL